MTDTQPFMPPRRLGTAQQAPRRGLLRDMLTFDRMLTGQLINLVYWAGLGVVAMVAFGSVGAAGGIISKGGFQSVLLAIPVLVIGLLIALALAILWRSFCEFYLTVFRIGEDLRALRTASDAGVRPPGLG